MKNVILIELEAQVQWDAVQGDRNGVWVGVCDALNLSVEAASLDELHSLIPESIHLLMTDLVMDNEFDQYLRERGWRTRGTPDPDAIAETKFHVPWHMMVPEGRNDSQRRAG
jgi:hypothetical protein